jgi:hypothetical protein
MCDVLHALHAAAALRTRLCGCGAGCLSLMLVPGVMSLTAPEACDS